MRQETIELYQVKNSVTSIPYSLSALHTYTNENFTHTKTIYADDGDATAAAATAFAVVVVWRTELYNRKTNM